MWPANSWMLKIDLIMSVISLVCSNLCDITIPIALKYTINELSNSDSKNTMMPYYTILVYGCIRFASNFFSQLRDIFFSTVSAETERRAALDTFTHIQRLSLNYHMQRETGKILRSVSRGSQSFSMLVRIVLFQFIPVLLQVSIVCIYLLANYTYWYSIITFSIILLYIIFTIVTTRFRDKQRKIMNEKDNQMNQIGMFKL